MGPSNTLLLLLKHLREQYDVAVVLPGYGSFTRALERERIPFFSLASMTKGSIPSLFRLIRGERFSLVYGNNTSSCSRNGILAARLANVPTICQVHAMGWGKSWRDLGFLKLAHATIAVSKACARSISRFVPPDRLHVVYNGVETSPLEAGRDGPRSRLLAETGLSPRDVIATSVSHICPRKGQEYAIQAMANIVAQAPSVHLLLVGSLDRDVAYVERIRAMIRAARLDDHVSMVGFRTDAEQLMRGSDLLLHTAIADPHPLAVLEGMAVRLPVVAFSVDGVAETIKHGQTGYLVPKGDVTALADSVLHLAADASLRMQLGSNARAHVEEHFSAESTARKIGDIIGITLNNRSRRRWWSLHHRGWSPS